MSLILEKRVLFWGRMSALQKKRVFFLGISLKKVHFLVLQVSVFEKKESVIGVFFFNLENDHTFPFYIGSGRTGLWTHSES